MSIATQPQQYREVQRKANAGERIKIVAAQLTCGRYSNGSELVVSDVLDSGVYADHPHGARVGSIWHREYVVLEPIVTPALNLPDLFAQFIRDNAPAVRSYLAEIDPDKCAEPTEEVSVSEPQLTRAKVIEMARERVAYLTARLPFNGEIKFRVNRERRTVVAEVYRNGVRAGKFYAKCAPDDVFNADIGKAIAAERALGLTLTEAFVNAPKPTEPVVGMRVENRGRVRTVVASSKGYVYGKTGTLKSQGVRESRIIDDTDAEYTQQDGDAA